MHIVRRLVVMYKWVEDRLFKKTLDKIERAAVIYRYISWMTTSAFYLSEPRMNVLFKIGVKAHNLFHHQWVHRCDLPNSPTVLIDPSMAYRLAPAQVDDFRAAGKHGDAVA